LTCGGAPFFDRKDTTVTHQHAHAHSHDAAHGHSHGGHVHAPANFGAAFAIGIALNAAFVLAEVGFGAASHSIALLSDAGHNLSDVLGLVVAWGGAALARRAPTARFTYGWRGASILAALFNAVFLLIVVGGLSWEAIQRLGQPEPVGGLTVMIVAAVGILVNGITAWLFASGRDGDINIRGAFLHMASDAAVSAGVVIAGLIILATGWRWLDPAISLAINAFIVWSTWGLLHDSVTMSLNAVPPNIDPTRVKNFLETLPGVAELHDLHIWPMSATETALTCHLVMPAGHPGDPFLLEAAHELEEHFRIGHATLQIEISEETACRGCV
jgi:cobalt-zinc-cadmium efflux system protein